MILRKQKKQKVAVGLSGGVDSSVAAYLLVKQGYEVTGVFMQCWDARADGCKSEEDRAFAVSTAAKLGIKFEHLDFRKEYKTKVMKYFFEEYKNGRTPNPDVMCNKEIKFGLFFDWAMKNKFEFVATGHYARIEKKANNKFELLKGKDSSKDQSYFLYLLTQKHLAKTLFPIGGMKKKEVRTLANKVVLPTARRAESMGICFIGEVDIKDFLKKHIAPKVGKVTLAGGEVIGEHEGVWYYTIGQRHGFKLSKYIGKPMYVVSKDAASNTLVVGEEKDATKSTFLVKGVHWINQDGTNPEMNCEVRIRHLGELQRARIAVRNLEVEVKTKAPIFGVAPGQSAVFYHRERVLGGGIIV